MQYQHNLEVFSRSGEKLIQVQCQYPNYTSGKLPYLNISTQFKFILKSVAY